MKVLLATLLLVAIAHSSLAAPWWQFGLGEEGTTPAFCGSYQCPNFTILETSRDYELRQYEKSSWVTADVKLKEPFWEDSSNMSSTFMKLFKYISGMNDRERTMEMTVPVLLSHNRDTVSMAFMIPAEFTDNPPQPTDSDVSIYNAPKSQFYFTSFSGFAYGIFGNRNYYKTNFEQLKQTLDQQGKSYDDSQFCTAGYDSHYNIIPFLRHNEVWIPKNRNTMCHCQSAGMINIPVMDVMQVTLFGWCTPSPYI